MARIGESTVTLEDGTVLKATPDNRDLVRYDRARAQKNWPSVSDAPLFWMSWITWSALKRTQQLPAHLATYEAFEDVCVEIDNATEDPEAVKGELDPTQPTAESSA